MTGSQELAFFVRVLRKAGIGCREFSLGDGPEPEIDAGLRRQLALEPPAFAGCRAFLPHMEHSAVYHVADGFYLHYLFLRLPEGERFLAVGPYLSMRPSGRQVLETAERCGLPPARTRLLEEFYPMLPQIADNSPFYAMLYCLCETFSGGPTQVRQFSLEEELAPAGLTAISGEADLSAAMQRLENRYRFEEEIMQAVAAGDRITVQRLLRGVDLNASMEDRLADPVRNIKNYCIVLNTVLRKAAQRGGVHPLYVDDLSRTLAGRIERLPTTGAARRLVPEMADRYALLVEQHSTSGYSGPVQRAMLYVRRHLESPLNLRVVAGALGCNASYFSARFKKETGRTLTDFIVQERLRRAAHLLLTTRLQVQSVAQHCGYLDVNYFSHTFRQVMGCTPTEYRKTGGALYR